MKTFATAFFCRRKINIGRHFTTALPNAATDSHGCFLEGSFSNRENVRTPIQIIIIREPQYFERCKKFFISVNFPSDLCNILIIHVRTCGVNARWVQRRLINIHDHSYIDGFSQNFYTSRIVFFSAINMLKTKLFWFEISLFAPGHESLRPVKELMVACQAS